MKKFNLNFKNRTDLILLIILIISIAAGLIIRLKGLGKWSLALDEFYTVKSAENILKYGVPMWDSGGFYMRGIFIKYITAFVFWIGFEPEFGSRLITVIANMLALPPLYLLAKKISGKIFATALVVVFCFSVWEVEFARFARMYTPFQAIFLCYIFFLYKNVIEDDNKSWKWLFILSFISLFIHESGIFIVALNFFPFIWKRKLILSKFVISLFLLFVSYYYLTFDFWNLNLPDVMPADIIYEGNDFTHEGYFRIPDLLINFISFQNIFEWLFIIPLLFTIFVIIKVFSAKLNLFAKILLFFVLALSVLNQFALSGLLLLLGFLFEWISLSDFKNKHFKKFIFALLLNCSAWILFLLMSDSWHSIFPAGDIVSFADLIKKAGLVLFNYPFNYFTYLMYYNAIPYFTIVASLILFSGLVLFFAKKFKEIKNGFRLILIIVIINVLMVLVVNTPISETRYTFYFFPLILLLILLIFQKISDTILTNKSFRLTSFLLITIILLFISEDFGSKHLINIDSKEINFRIGFNERLERHYYPRWDVEGCAEFVNKKSKPEDIIIINEPNISYYLNRVDYFYEDYRSGRFGAITTEAGTKERWTNAKLIYTIPALMDVFNSGKRIWFVGKGKMYFNEVPFYNEINDHIAFLGLDKKMGVLLFEAFDE